MSTSLLITGAGGWLGAALADLLRHTEHRAQNVIAVLGPSDGDDAERRWGGVAEVWRGDLRDPAFTARLPRAHHVIHAAGVIHEHGNHRFTDNLTLTQAAWSLLAEGGVYTLVSSNSAVGVGELGAYESGDSRCVPVGGYGRSKYESEVYVRQQAETTGVRVAVLRACWFYGPNPPDRQQRFQRMASGGWFPLVAGGRLRRSISYTGDLALAALTSFEVATCESPSYWVVDPAEYTISQIVAARGPKRRVAGIYLPRNVARIVARIDDALQRAGRYNQSVHVLGELAEEIVVPRDLAEAHRRALGLPERTALYNGVAVEVATGKLAS